MTLIDLDQPPPGASRREPSPRRRLVTTVALMLLAAALGGLATYQWQRLRGRSAVHVVVLADVVPSAAGYGTTIYESGNGVGKVQAVIHLDVVNTGPAPVRMVAVNVPAIGMRPGAWMPMDRSIAPGQGAISTLIADIDCLNTPPPGAAPATFEIAGADGKHPHVVVADATPAWNDELALTCSKP